MLYFVQIFELPGYLEAYLATVWNLENHFERINILLSRDVNLVWLSVWVDKVSNLDSDSKKEGNHLT